MSLPLEGILVVTLEQAVAAPFCSSRLADAGARVIKLERPEGYFGRSYDDVAHGESSYFVWLNRGKESVVVDLGRPDGRELFEALIAKADVFIQNLKPGSLARLGYPIEDLRARHPRLIACSISGYGEEGVMAERKAYDLLIQAESGLASITGGPGEPARVGISVVDISTGASAMQAILEALFKRERTGHGADIRLSMFDTIVDWMAVPFIHASYGRDPKRIGLAHPSIAPYGVFTSRDGRSILISIQNEREWLVLCRQVLDDPEFATDPRFLSNVVRVTHRGLTDARVQLGFAKFDHATLSGRLARAQIAFAAVNSLQDLLQHPHLRTISIETPSGPVTVPAPAALVKGEQRRYGAVPALGADTEEVRAEFLGIPAVLEGTKS
jgi:itaconate CoA-transferase